MTEDLEAAFIAQKISINAFLTEIAEHSENLFNVRPKHITQGHVGILTDIEKTLTDLADRLARRAEYAIRTAQAGASLGGQPSPESTVWPAGGDIYERKRMDRKSERFIRATLNCLAIIQVFYGSGVTLSRPL